MLTDRELQTLRNLGGLCEDAVVEIETLRAANFSLAAGTCVVQGGLLGDEGGTPYCALQADAKRMRWILAGHGYFMEEEMLCGHGPCSEEEQHRARRRIDEAMALCDTCRGSGSS